MLKLFQPAPVIDPLPKERVDKEYKKLRLQVFLGIFIGYAGYYLVRKNFSIAMPALEQMDLFVFHPEDKLPNSIYTGKIHHAY